MTLLIPSRAEAIPTPDVLFGMSQALPGVLVALSGVMSVAALAFRRFVNRRKDPQAFLVKSVGVLALVCCASFVAITVLWLRGREVERERDIAAYFRCDIASHEAQHLGDEMYASFDKAGRSIGLAEIDAHLRRDPSYRPVLFTVTLDLIYDAGFLIVGPDANRTQFRLVHQGELRDALMSIPPEQRADKEIVVDIVQRMFFGRSAEADLAEYFALFPRLKILRPRDDRKPYLYVTDSSDTVRHAVFEPLESRGWPVRNERYYFEQSHVDFPNMKRLIRAEELGPLVDDKTISLVVPYDSGQRSYYVQVEYISGLLRDRLPESLRGRLEAEDPTQLEAVATGFDRANVLLFDGNTPHYYSEVARMRERLRGKKYVVIGITKYDWIHIGLNLAYLLETRTPGTTDGYLGGSLQIAEFAAARAVDAKPSLWASTTASLRRGIATLLGMLDGLPGSIGSALLLFGFAIRLALLPLLAAAALSRSRRLDLDALFQADVAAARPTYYLDCRWFGGARLRIRRGYETLAGLASAIVLLPMYSLLVYDGSPIMGAGYLWIPDLGRPELWCNVLLVALVGVRLWTTRPAGKRSRWGTLGTIVILAGFLAVLQAAVPAAIALLATQGVVVNLVVDQVVAWLARPTHDIVVLRPGTDTSGAPRETSSAITRLVDLPRESHVGIKARRLGELARAGSTLFRIPSGFVVHLAGAGSATWKSQLARELDGMERKRFAVRSCAHDEDVEMSNAGKYLSVLKVAPPEIADAVERVRDSYGASGTDNAVLVQEMADADYSGVIFTSSPIARGMAHIEFGRGLADQQVSGATSPHSAYMSRFSGEIAGDADREHRAMLEQVFVAAMAVERFVGTPQDIEWTYRTRDRQLFIVQSRNITAYVQSAALADEQRFAVTASHRAGAKTRSETVWTRNAVVEVVDRACPFSLSLLEELYAPEGAIGYALAALGLSRLASNRDRPQTLFGRLYDRARVRQPLIRGLFALAAQRRARRFLATSWKDVVREDARRLDEVRSRYRRASEALDGGTIASDVEVFVREVYPLVFKAALAAELVESITEERKPVTTVHSQYLADLSTLAVEGRLEPFLERWGHRSVSDYDLLSPSFFEEPEQALEYAKTFVGLKCGRSDEPPADAYSAFVQSREAAKDVALLYLRHVLRPRCHQVAKDLGVQPVDDLFYLTLGELRDVKELSPAAVHDLVAKRRAHHQAVVACELADRLSIADLEMLMLPPSVVRARGVSEATCRGRMLSVEHDFEGRVVEAAGPVDGSDRIVVISKTLRPELVSLFSRASGVVTQLGGYLSHAAVVAREMNIPVLLLENAYDVVKLGDIVRVAKDGSVVITGAKASEAS